ncbi:14368_t:CDS:2 [Cetraspora pellucida]|uniref:14368_t:CDS:1 n=1 Tax=Cetraspora pellucida TaxID=1433469 RepID=A0ACA9LS61_9GLOM|nr:14368_t:CDS:2 [Cetraspora pellucida]
MATTTRAKHRQLEEQQSTLLTEDERHSEDQSLDYVSDNDVFTDAYNKGVSSDNEDNLPDISQISDNETNQESNLNTSSELLIPAKRKKPIRITTKPKSSFVWKFFSQPHDGKVCCQIANCKAVLGYCNTPSTMKAHLHNKHQITKASLDKKSIDEFKKTPTLQSQLTLQQSLEITKPHLKAQTQKLNNSLLRFIINSVQPLTIVEDKDFIRYSYDLDPKYKLPCRQVLKDKIDEAYYNNIIKIQQQINKAKYVSHFISHEILLTIKEIPYPHTAIMIKEEVEKLINKFQLESKLYAIVSDNRSNVKSAINQLKIGTHIGCTAHTLQLSITKGIQEIDQLVIKCKNLIKFLSQDKKQQQLREAQLYLINQQGDNNKLDNEEKYVILNVVKANNTRWNSVYYAFEHLIILKSAIITLKETLLQDTSTRIRQEGELLEDLIPSIYEWKIIREVVQILEPFEQLTRLFSGQYYPTLNLIYPCMISLQNSFFNESTNYNTSEAIKIQKIIQEDLTLRGQTDFCLLLCIIPYLIPEPELIREATHMYTFQLLTNFGGIYKTPSMSSPFFSQHYL